MMSFAGCVCPGTKVRLHAYLYVYVCVGGLSPFSTIPFSVLIGLVLLLLLDDSSHVSYPRVLSSFIPIFLPTDFPTNNRP